MVVGAIAKTRKCRSRRLAGLVCGVIAFGALIFGWLGVRDALAVRADLTNAKRVLSSARVAIAAIDVPETEHALGRARVWINAAERRTRSLPLRAIASVPLLGRSIDTARAVADAAGLAVDAGFECVDAVRLFPIRDGPLGSMVDGRIDLGPWMQARAHLQRAHDLVQQAVSRVDHTSASWLVGSIARTRSDALRELSRFERVTSWGFDASVLTPSMLGEENSRKYLLVFQNLAEARATGGLVAGFALIEGKQGRLSLQKVASDTELVTSNSDVPMPDWFSRRYDLFDSRRLWSNVNMEPDFRVTGPLMAGLFARTIGPHVDGVIATDPIGLQQLLRVTGPVQGPRGIVVDADTVARLIMSDVYRNYEADRKALLVDVATRIWAKLLERSDMRNVADAIVAAARARHLTMWSADPSEQTAIEDLDIAGGFGAARDPFIGVVTQNGAGNKVDYFIRRSLNLVVRMRPDGGATFRAAIRLRNDAPSSGLPRVVLGPNPLVPDLAPGADRIFLSVYLPPDAHIRSFQLGDAPATFESDLAPGAVIVSKFLTVGSRSSSDVTIEWQQDRVLPQAGVEKRFALTVLRQPTVSPDAVSLSLMVPEGFRAGSSSPGVRREGEAVVLRADADGDVVFQATVSRPLWGRIWRPLFVVLGLGAIVLGVMTRARRQKRLRINRGNASSVGASPTNK